MARHQAPHPQEHGVSHLQNNTALTHQAMFGSISQTHIPRHIRKMSTAGRWKHPREWVPIQVAHRTALEIHCLSSLLMGTEHTASNIAVGSSSGLSQLFGRGVHRHLLQGRDLMIASLLTPTPCESIYKTPLCFSLPIQIRLVYSQPP